MAKKISLKPLVFFLTLIVLSASAFAQNPPKISKEAWVDSVFQTLNTEEKIGQLIFVRVPTISENDQGNLIEKIKDYRIGGAIIMNSSPVNHARFVNKIQNTSRVPLLMAAEGISGLGYVVDSVLTFPHPLALSAVQNDSLLREVGKEIANEMKTLGFQFNLLLPSKKSWLFFETLKDNGVMGLYERDVRIAGGYVRTSYEGNGLVISDVSNIDTDFEATETDSPIPTYLVGNDMIIGETDLSEMVSQLKKSLRRNDDLQELIDTNVKKILAAKYDAGLANIQPVSTENLVRRLNSMNAQLLQQEVTRKSITLVANEANTLPIQTLENKRFATITIGKDKKNEFTHTLSKYVAFDHFDLKSLNVDEINKYDVVVMGVYPMASLSFDSLRTFLSKIQPKQKIICEFGDVLQLDLFNSFAAAIATYSDNPISEKSAAQMIFGAMSFEGQLPVSINSTMSLGTSIATKSLQRFTYGLPEEVGMDGQTLEQIKRIAQEAIESGGTPGCHVLVAHKGKVVFDQSFGWYTYDHKIPVTEETIYDLASITKVAATLQAVMFLSEKGNIDIHKKASVYLPELRSTNKKDITIKDMLTHQSGLLPFIPMWPNTVKDKVLMPYYYSSLESDKYPLQVAPNLFTVPAIRDSAWHWVLNSKMGDRQPRTPYVYRYSDMASMIFHHMVERIINQPMNEFLEQNFYEPLGAGTLGFQPLSRFDASRVAPTEIDTIFRKQLIHGTVHDERAAMLGGIAGHAGLFGTATDLAKVGQMLLQGGSYGGTQFFKPETVNLFTSKQYENSRRGLGWDKPIMGDFNSPTTDLASAKTFGHTGFTGTCIWVDPEFDLVYVFLSNRVWPDRSNKLLNANIRPRIQEVIYKSIFNYCQFQGITRN